MSSAQRNLLVAYAAILALMIVYPPTVITSHRRVYAIGQGYTQEVTQQSGGFRFIGELGGYSYSPGFGESTSMDYLQLAIQVIVGSFIAVALWFVLGVKPSQPKQLLNTTRGTDPSGQ